MRCDTSAYGVLSQEKLRCVSWWNNCYKYWYDIHSKVYIYIYILKKNDSIWVSVCHTPVMSSSWGSRLPRTEGTLRVEWNGNLFGKNTTCLLWLVCASGNWLKPLFLGHPVFDGKDHEAKDFHSRSQCSIAPCSCQCHLNVVYKSKLAILPEFHGNNTVHLKFISKTNPDKPAVNLLLNPLSVYGDLPKPIVKNCEHWLA